MEMEIEELRCQRDLAQSHVGKLLKKDDSSEERMWADEWKVLKAFL